MYKSTKIYFWLPLEQSRNDHWNKFPLPLLELDPVFTNRAVSTPVLHLQPIPYLSRVMIKLTGNLDGFQTGPTHPELYKEDGQRLRKKRNCTIRVAKTKSLISFAVFAYAKCWFSHNATHLFFTASSLKTNLHAYWSKKLGTKLLKNAFLDQSIINPFFIYMVDLQFYRTFNGICHQFRNLHHLT